jgi:hypothetical protein
MFLGNNPPKLLLSPWLTSGVMYDEGSGIYIFLVFISSGREQQHSALSAGVSIIAD